MLRRDDLLLVELGEILRVSDGAGTLVAVAAAIRAHFDLARCGFVTLPTRPGDPSLDDDDLRTLTAGQVVVRERYVASPLMGDRATVLVLATAEPRTWDPAALALVGEVAERAWLWVERVRLVGELRDAAGQREQRVVERTAALERSLGEKTILLREIHHRVQNNLQVVSSLLGLQRDHVVDPIARAALEDSQHRVRSMALVHAKLYRSKDLANVPFADYLRELVVRLVDSLEGAARRIAIVVDADPTTLTLTVDQAIPCGLVVNELVTNALKHAFPDRATGTITLTLVQAGERVVLGVRDDGIGLPADLAFTATFGLDMLLTFVEQLDAHLEVTRSPGTSIVVSFPLAHA